MTMASSTTKPVAMVSAIRVRLLSEKCSRYIAPKVPTRDSGTATEAMKVAATLRRKTKITAVTSSNRQEQLELHVVHRGADAGRAVVDDLDVDGGRHGRRKVGQALLDLVDGGDDVGARLALDIEQDAPGVRSYQAPSWVFSAPAITWATSDRRTGAPLR